MRKIWAFWALATLSCAVPALADSITVEHTSVCIQSVCVYGTTDAELPDAAHLDADRHNDGWASTPERG